MKKQEQTLIDYIKHNLDSLSNSKDELIKKAYCEQILMSVTKLSKILNVELDKVNKLTTRINDINEPIKLIDLFINLSKKNRGSNEIVIIDNGIYSYIKEYIENLDGILYKTGGILYNKVEESNEFSVSFMRCGITIHLLPSDATFIDVDGNSKVLRVDVNTKIENNE